MSRDFDGVDDRIQWSPTSALRLAGDMTYAAWVKPASAGAGIGDNVIVSFGGLVAGAASYYYGFSIDATGELRAVWTYDAFGNTEQVVSSVASADLTVFGTWRHVAFTRNASSKVVRFYVDGVQLGSDVAYANNPSVTGGGHVLLTGADALYPESLCFHGEICEEGTWGSVLSGTKIATVYGTLRRYAPTAVPQSLVSYRPLTGDLPLEYDRVAKYVTGSMLPAGSGPAGLATGLVVFHGITAAGRGAHGSSAGFSARGRGAFRSGYQAIARRETGVHAVTAAFAARGRGAARAYNAFSGRGRGAARLSQTSYRLDGRGAHMLYAAHGRRERGAYRVAYDPYKSAGRGAHPVLSGYRGLGRGKHWIGGIFARRAEGGVHRVANDALARYELYRGVNAAPDLDAAPWQTFTALPFTTPALAPGNTYRFVLRRRNAWGLSSRNVAETVLTLDAGGNELSPPSAPANVAAAPAAGGTILVTADYEYGSDGAAQADSFLVYTRTGGTDPDPATDTPAVVAMEKADGVARLELTTAAYAEGTVVKAVVRTRRTGPPDADSTNTTPVVGATATLLGPASPSPAAVLQGKVLEQAQAG